MTICFRKISLSFFYFIFFRFFFFNLFCFLSSIDFFDSRTLKYNELFTLGFVVYRIERYTPPLDSETSYPPLLYTPPPCPRYLADVSVNHTHTPRIPSPDSLVRTLKARAVAEASRNCDSLPHNDHSTPPSYHKTPPPSCRSSFVLETVASTCTKRACLCVCVVRAAAGMHAP